MMTRAIDREVDGMCDLSRGVRDEGHAEGLKQGLEKGRIAGLSEVVMNMMVDTNKPITEVMNALKIDKEIQPEVIKYINSLNQ